MSVASIRIWTELPGPTINPNIYGHFVEHLGRCVYGGMWVGLDSSISNVHGFRSDVIAALKHLRVPVVRWPGGCFADTYHWRDGIGPRDKRPVTPNTWWKQTESNACGTDEFMRFCKAVGCAPYLCVNVGSGTPREALEWLEYCNYGGDTTLTRMRAANGHADPHGVKYWAVGNENWGCGGRFPAKDYSNEYVRFATYLRSFDPVIELVACGTSGDDNTNPVLTSWNLEFCEAQIHADLIDHLSIHRYFSRGTATGFTENEFHALFGDLVSMERDIVQTDRVLGYFYPDKSVGVVIDEWGLWHPSAVVENGLEQANTLRDAVFAGACLNLFNRYANRVTMANLAQTVNVLQCVMMTDGPKLVLTPTYHAFDLMRAHMGANLLTIDVDSPTFETHPRGLRAKHSSPMLNVSASMSGRDVHVTVANQSATTDVEARLDFRDAVIAGVSGRLLNANSSAAVNTVAEPNAVAPKILATTRLERIGIAHVFPAHSLTALTFTLG